MTMPLPPLLQRDRLVVPRPRVVAAGNGRVRDDGERVPLDVKAGDTILFAKYAGEEVRVDGVEYLIMKEDDVLGVESSSATSDNSQMDFSWSI